MQTIKETLALLALIVWRCWPIQLVLLYYVVWSRRLPYSPFDAMFIGWAVWWVGRNFQEEE